MQLKEALAQLKIDEIDAHLVEQPDLLFVVPQAPNKAKIFHRLYNTYLHRLILKPTQFQVVDHINGNPLDNRRCNLRLATPAENACNRSAHHNSMYSAFKGVSYCKLNKKWKAKIKAGPVTKQKWFLSELEAAMAYNEWATQLHGKFARLNPVTAQAKVGPNFDKDLLFAQTHESYFCAQYPHLFKRVDGRKWDIETLAGAGVELKFDRRHSESTPNLFIETIRNTATGAPGGPYQAAQHGATYFVYVFADNYEFYCFKLPELIDLIKRERFKSVKVFNGSNYTEGVLLPKSVALQATISLNSL